jgi:cell division septation protein DedD
MGMKGPGMMGKTTGQGATSLSDGLRLAFPVMALLMLTACEGGLPSLGGGEGTDGAEAATSVELVETDVEAPEIFQVTAEGLWDGRPSLGGVWVAHPDVTQPERVIIRNESNGTFVIGALFRRERENPGPVIQVSSDAAEALQMLAGAPVNLNVTALRREEAATPATETAPPPTDASATDLAPAPEIGVTTLDPVAGAAAAIEAAEAAGVPGTEASPAPVAPAPAAAPTGATDLSRPYIQLGIFSVEANANELAQEMQSKGLSARVVAQESQGRSFWRVLVGPATTEAQRQAWLDQVKAEGFADAYFVSN